MGSCNNTFLKYPAYDETGKLSFPLKALIYGAESGVSKANGRML